MSSRPDGSSATRRSCAVVAGRRCYGGASRSTFRSTATSSSIPMATSRSTRPRNHGARAARPTALRAPPDREAPGRDRAPDAGQGTAVRGRDNRRPYAPRLGPCRRHRRLPERKGPCAPTRIRVRLDCHGTDALPAPVVADGLRAHALRPRSSALRPFPESKTLTADGGICLVPLPGHSIAQVGAIVQINGHALLLAADHMLRQDWFVEDYRAGQLLGLGIFFPELARQTSRRIHRFAQDTPTVLLPTHDADAPARLATMQQLIV